MRLEGANLLQIIIGHFFQLPKLVQTGLAARFNSIHRLVRRQMHGQIRVAP